MRRRGLKGFVLLCEQEVLRAFGTLVHFESEIPRLFNRTCPIGSGSSQECGLLAMLHCDENEKLCQLGWINQFTTFLLSNIAVSTL